MCHRKTDTQTGWRWTGYVKKAVCDRCPEVKNLVVHHKDRDHSNNADLSNLETLCRTCHRLEHAKEITAAQQRDEVNARRGASISKSKALQRQAGTKYPKVSERARKMWKGSGGEKLRKIHASAEHRALRTEVMKMLWQRPEYRENQMKSREARRAEKK